MLRRLSVSLIALVSLNSFALEVSGRCSSQALSQNQKLQTWHTLGLQETPAAKDTVPLMKDLMATKVDCIYRAMAEEFGAPDPLMLDLFKSGKFKAAIDSLKAEHAALQLSAPISSIQTACPPVKGNLMADKCVLTKFGESLDVILTAQAIREVLAPTILPLPKGDPKALTFGQLHEMHIQMIHYWAQ